jgi:hypothetical protein
VLGRRPSRTPPAPVPTQTRRPARSRERAQQAGRQATICTAHGLHRLGSLRVLIPSLKAGMILKFSDNSLFDTVASAHLLQLLCPLPEVPTLLHLAHAVLHGADAPARRPSAGQRRPSAGQRRGPGPMMTISIGGLVRLANGKQVRKDGKQFSKEVRVQGWSMS